jgi:hypothetical protein
MQEPKPPTEKVASGAAELADACEPPELIIRLF